MKEPKRSGPVVTLGGVPLMSQRINYVWTSGAKPGLLKLVFEREIAEKFIAAAEAGGGLEFRIQHEMLGFGEPQDVDVTIPDLQLLVPDGTSSPWEVTLTLADPRVWLQTLRHSGTYNLRRETNERKISNEEANGVRVDHRGSGRELAGSTTTSVGGLAADALSTPGAFRRVINRARQNYLEWTIKANGRPYTAKDICLHVLETELFVAHRSAAPVLLAFKDVIRGLPDNHYVESDVMIRNEPLPAVLATWMAKAEIGIAPREGRVKGKGRSKGKMVAAGGFYGWRTTRDEDLDKVISPFLSPVMGGGFLSVEDKRLVRAQEVLVGFPRAEEVLLVMRGWEYLPGELQKFSLFPPRRELYNVLKLTDTIKLSNRTWPKGMWVSIRTALALWLADGSISRISKNPLAAQITTNSDWIEKNWFPTGLIRMAGYRVEASNQLAADRIWGPRMAELERRFLQTWMIDPVLMQYVLEVKLERAAIVDPIRNEPASVYVSTDHAEIYELGLTEEILNFRAKAATNVTAQKNPRDAVGAPASLISETGTSGIYTIQFDSFYSGRWLKQVVPTKILEDKIPPHIHLGALMNTGNPAITKVWHNAQLQRASDHQGFIILLMVYGIVPPKTSKIPRVGVLQRKALLYEVEVKATDVGWRGKTNARLRVELNSRSDTARFPLDDNLNVAKFPVNKDTLDALAKHGPARLYYHAQRDRLIGRFTVPGYAKAYRLFGGMRSLEMVIEENGRVQTTFDFTEPPPAPDIYTLLPAPIRRQLYQELPVSRKARAAGKA